MSEFVDCRTCKTNCVRNDGNYGYTFCDKYTHTPMSNADWIRAMSDEELVKYLFDVEQGNFTIDCCDDRFCDTQNCCHDCTDAAIKWLQQPVENTKEND